MKAELAESNRALQRAELKVIDQNKVISDLGQEPDKKKRKASAAKGKPTSPDRSSFLNRYLTAKPKQSVIDDDSGDSEDDDEQTPSKILDDSSSEDDSSDDASEREDQEDKFKQLASFFLQGGKKDKKKKHHLKNSRYKTLVPSKDTDPTTKPLMKGAPEFLAMIFRSIYGRKEVKLELEAIKRPKNADALKPVKVNPEIYLRMTEKERKKDEPLKYIQNAVAKAAMPLAEAWNLLLDLEDSVRSTATPKMDDDEAGGGSVIAKSVF